MKNFRLLLIITILSLLSSVDGQSVIPVGSYPCALVYNTTNAKLYCANFGDNTVSVINIINNQVIATIRVGTGPVALVYNPTSNKVYCANQQSNDVSIINGATNEVINTVTVGSYPSNLLFNPATNKVYCANSSSNSISVIDGVNDNVIATVNVGAYPTALTHNSANNKIYCANTDNESVSIIDGVTNQVIATVPVGRTPNSLAYNPDNNEVYCSSWSNGRIHMIDGLTNQKVDSIIYGNSGPQSLIYVGYNKIAYVNFTGDNIKMIDGSVDTIIATYQFPFGARPYALAYFYYGEFILSANIGNNSISFFWHYNYLYHYVTLNNINYPVAVSATASRFYVTNLWSSTVTIFYVIAIDEQSSFEVEPISLSIYPNPARTFFTIRFSQNADYSEIKMFDVAGKMAKKQEFKSLGVRELRVSLDGLNQGVYFVQVNNQPLIKIEIIK